MTTDLSNKEAILHAARAFVQEESSKHSDGHDWSHIERVTTLAVRLAEHMGADPFVCELAALLHDVPDEKLNDSLEAGMAKLHTWLDNQALDFDTRESVVNIISTISFAGGQGAAVDSLEAQVVQDADRLDALGAIGIARTFAFSGARGREMYDPSLPPREQMTREEYRNGRSTTINHFYEKLFKLKDLMNTSYGKELAQRRHEYMVQFVEQFKQEWEGTDV
ncbi:HD domain-containing protein [Paenibacillus polysaccharolyticus]|uniref:HD domain-containing protein n=1 Tax=Paenibacillus polysaccharolyticus TaxID=582692 RepID=UPI00203BD502|nr:HD domain-containing protein [Paenibacillus polysaccharolyticus]MCM3131783.1 HD domain-containing protein [Paenibacillus polysaccharolyticus]